MRRIIQYFVLALTFLLAVWATLLNWDVSKSDWAAWAQAVSSLIAVAAALFIVQIQEAHSRKREATRDAQHTADKLAIAELTAAKISASLARTANIVHALDVALIFRDVTVSGHEAQGQEVEALLRFAGEDLFSPRADVLKDLMPLPNRSAHRIGRAFDLLDLLRKRILQLDLFVFDSYNYDEREAMMITWKRTVSDASNLLTVASAACVTAADIGAPFPDGEELYGPFVDSE
jgi:hypothetical protein